MLSGRGMTLVIVFVLLWALLFWGIGIGKLLFGSSLWGLLIGLVVGIVLAVIAVKTADKLLLKIARASPVNLKKYADLAEAAQVYSQKYRIPLPGLYVTPEMLPNFYVFGSSIDKCNFVFTRGFLDNAQPQSLSAAIGWAIISARRGSLQMRTLGSALAYIFMIPAKIGDVISMGSEARYNMLNLLLLLPLAPLACILVRMAGGNQDIYITDNQTTQLTGDQGYLGITLIDIEKNMGNYTVDTDLSLVPLFIAPPNCTNFYFKLFRTFPPVAKRIHRLRMQRQQARS